MLVLSRAEVLVDFLRQLYGACRSPAAHVVLFVLLVVTQTPTKVGESAKVDESRERERRYNRDVVVKLIKKWFLLCASPSPSDILRKK
jgi:hypothetical protein